MSLEALSSSVRLAPSTGVQGSNGILGPGLGGQQERGGARRPDRLQQQPGVGLARRMMGVAVGRPVATTALFHPPYLLRTPGQKRLAWRDLLALLHKLDDPGG